MISKVSANKTSCINKPLSYSGPIFLELMKNVIVPEPFDNRKGENVIHAVLFKKFLKRLTIGYILI